MTDQEILEYRVRTLELYLINTIQHIEDIYDAVTGIVRYNISPETVNKILSRTDLTHLKEELAKPNPQ